MRVGIIGCGRAGLRLHLPALRSIPEVRVTALADPDPKSLERAGTMCTSASRYRDYAQLIADSQVDLVVVAPPTPYHCRAALAAMEAGKHVYIEKPLALTLEEADSMLAAEASARGRIAVGFNLRSHRLVERARLAIQSGVPGRILWIRAGWAAGISERPEWQKRRAEGGGALSEMGTHHFDLWRYLLGDEVESAQAQLIPANADDVRVAVSARLRSGALATSAISFTGTEQHEIEVMGEKRRVAFSMYRADSFQERPAGRAAGMAQWVRELPEAVASMRRGGDFIDSYRRHWERFLGAIRDGGPVPATLADGRAAMEILERVR